MAVNGFLVDNEVQKYNYESLENYNTPDFSTSSTYQVGDYVMHQGKLYRCTTAITTGGIWNSTKWSLAILSDDVADLKETTGDTSSLQTTTKTNLVAAINELYQQFSSLTGASRTATDETIIQSIDKTINLYNPETVIDNYIILNGVLTPQSNYCVSDYIEIGCVPFAHSVGGQISDQTSCYDGDKNYLGAISFAKNTDRQQVFDLGGANLRYTLIYPLEGTVYVRVNAPMSRPKMVTPFFSPLAFGASANDLAYNEVFTKYGLRVAMFGDSITLGRSGDSSEIFTENIPFYLQNLTGWRADNFGVGSMGWVSTQYLNEIAYDKISTTNLAPYDLITLAFGVNDTQANLGDWNSNDESTICGQINKCIRYIATTNNKARIVLIAPWNTGSGSFPGWRYPVVTARGWSREDMSQRMEQIADYFHIGFVSQFDSPLWGYGIGLPDGTKTHQFLGTDDVHPTASGYKALGHWLAGKLQAFTGSQYSSGYDESNIFWATYNVTTEAEVTAAVAVGKAVMLRNGDELFYLTKKEAMGPSGTAWIFVSARTNGGNTDFRWTFVSGTYWNVFGSFKPTYTASEVGAVAANQGSGNARKFLVVGSDGVVIPVAMSVWQGGNY